MSEYRRRYRPEVWETYNLSLAAHEAYPDHYDPPDEFDDIEVAEDPFLTADGTELRITADVIDQYAEVRAEMLIAEESGLSGEPLDEFIAYLKQLQES